LKRYLFSKKQRLAGNKEFEAVLACRKRVSDGMLVLYVSANDCGYPRLGISVGKSCGPAVQRNRLKRMLREAFRQNQDHIAPGFDYLLMISPQLSKNISKPVNSKKAAKELKFQQVKASFLALAKAVTGRAE
jgi:ribonuclease P protein component